MKKIDLFDTFENAEDELMEDFTDMSPEISDEKLDKLLAVSERNYEKEKAEIERTRKADNTDDENMVRGVERVKRPVWLRTAAMAASFVLIAGTVIGSIVLFNRGKSKKDLFNSDDLSNTDMVLCRMSIPIKRLLSNSVPMQQNIMTRLKQHMYTSFQIAII